MIAIFATALTVAFFVSIALSLAMNLAAVHARD